MAQPIVDRIIADAQAEATSIENTAKTRADQILAAAKTTAEAAYLEAYNKADRDAAELVSRRKTVANLEVKKQKLAFKRETLDCIFDRALAQLCALPAKEYGDLVSKLIDRYSEYNDQIVLAKGSPVEDSFVMALPVFEFKKLSLSRTRGDFKGGLMLIGKSYDKCLTFESLLDQFRVDHETVVADQLGAL